MAFEAGQAAAPGFRAVQLHAQLVLIGRGTGNGSNIRYRSDCLQLHVSKDQKSETRDDSATGTCNPGFNYPMTPSYGSFMGMSTSLLMGI